VNNAGSSINESGSPYDRGFGEYDLGQFDERAYVQAFCGCSVLIRRSAILERTIFIPEFLHILKMLNFHAG